VSWLKDWVYGSEPRVRPPATLLYFARETKPGVFEIPGFPGHVPQVVNGMEIVCERLDGGVERRKYRGKQTGNPC
jgi:hypothetical protein